MKRHYLATALSCLLLLALAFCVYSFMQEGRIQGSIKVGFLFENDEATPYTYTFSLARDALERAFAFVKAGADAIMPVKRSSRFETWSGRDAGLYSQTAPAIRSCPWPRFTRM